MMPHLSSKGHYAACFHLGAYRGHNAAGCWALIRNGGLTFR